MKVFLESAIQIAMHNKEEPSFFLRGIRPKSKFLLSTRLQDEATLTNEMLKRSQENFTVFVKIN